MIIYIGSGCNERAWSLGKRAAPHKKILNNIMAGGFSPADYVVILACGLTVAAARSAEATLIRAIQPMLNQQGVSAANAGRGIDNKLARMTDEIVRELRARHAQGGVSIRSLARSVGISYGAVHRAITGTGWSHVT